MTSSDAVANEALQCHGGNGFIEENPMARVYREAPLNSVWEGSANMMCMDVRRAMRKDPACREALLADLHEVRGQSKSFDTFAPIGPYIVTADEVPEPERLANRLWVNGELRQEASTADMIVGIAELIELISSVLPIQPGDVIATGTPEGVGPFAPGDTLRIAIEGVGDMSVQVSEREAPAPRPF